MSEVSADPVPPAELPTDLFSISAVAKKLGLPSRVVRAAVQSGKVPYWDFPGAPMVSLSDARSVLMACRRVSASDSGWSDSKVSRYAPLSENYPELRPFEIQFLRALYDLIGDRRMTLNEMLDEAIYHEDHEHLTDLLFRLHQRDRPEPSETNPHPRAIGMLFAAISRDGDLEGLRLMSSTCRSPRQWWVERTQ